MNDGNYKRRIIIAGRITALLSDGYAVVVSSGNIHWAVWKLRHKFNHNYITIVADFTNNHMTQRSNNRVVYDGAIQG